MINTHCYYIDDKLQLHKQLCEAMNSTAVGEVLRAVNELYCEDLYRHYLHDFVRLVHKCKHSKKHEYETKECGVRINFSLDIIQCFFFIRSL